MPQDTPHTHTERELSQVPEHATEGASTHKGRQLHKGRQHIHQDSTSHEVGNGVYILGHRVGVILPVGLHVDEDGHDHEHVRYTTRPPQHILDMHQHRALHVCIQHEVVLLEC